MEVIYRDLFVRDLAKLGIEDIFYPTGGAANYSLLYLIVRAYCELPVTSILEVGAGQSTRLLDALNRRFRKATIVTLEHDVAWADLLAKSVEHRVIHAPLVCQDISRRQVMFHDLKVLSRAERFDMILVDGPIGTRRYSRLGLLRIMELHMQQDNFLAIMDDAERPGEMQTLVLCRDWLAKNGVTHVEQELKAAKHQRIFAAGTFSRARYY